MFTEVVVQGFKSLRDVRVELGQVNVFVGANGSGKTNLLEAIGLLSAAANDQVDDQALKHRGVRPGVPFSLYESSFADIAVPQEITIGAKWYAEPDIDEYWVSFEKQLNAHQQPWPCKETGKHNGQVVWQLPGSEASLSQLLSQCDVMHGGLIDLLNSLRPYAIFMANTPTLYGKAIDVQRPPVGLAGGQLAEAVDELLDIEQGKFGTLELDELLELLGWVDEIHIVPLAQSVPTARIIRFTDRWMSDGHNQLPHNFVNEGALNTLFVLVLALHPRSPRLFAIDNFDQSMHPRLARATARLFCQQTLKSDPPRQALLTTHNPLVLDGLDLRDDRIRLFAVERNSRGATEVHRVQVSDEVVRATQEGLSLSNLWVMGRLGGVPDIF